MIIDRILNRFGNKAALAEALGVSRAAVTQWGCDGVPPAQAIKIELLTDGDIKAIDIIKRVELNECKDV